MHNACDERECKKTLVQTANSTYNASGEDMPSPKLPSWIMTLYGDAKQQKPDLSLEAFAGEYLELDELGEYHLKKRPTFRCAQPLERNKFGQEDQTDLFDRLDETGRELATRHAVEVVGLDLDVEMHGVFTSIQKLLSATNYEGNEQPLRALEDGQPIPRLRISPSEFAEAYGVKRIKTKRGKNELVGWDYQHALTALRKTSRKQFLFWERRQGPDGKNETVVGIRPAFLLNEIYKDLTEDERRRLLELYLLRLIPDEQKPDRIQQEAQELEAKAPYHKLVALTIDPDPLFVKRIKERFVVKDLNYLQEVKQLAGGRVSRYPVLFVDLLQLDASQKFVVERSGKTVPWIFKRRVSRLAKELRMEPWIKTRNAKQIREALMRCGEVAFKAGYLTDPPKIENDRSAASEVFVARMNRDKFSINLELDEKRARYEKKLREAEDEKQIAEAKERIQGGPLSRGKTGAEHTPPVTVKTVTPIDEAARIALLRQQAAQAAKLYGEHAPSSPPDPTPPDAV